MLLEDGSILRCKSVGGLMGKGEGVKRRGFVSVVVGNCVGCIRNASAKKCRGEGVKVHATGCTHI